MGSFYGAQVNDPLQRLLETPVHLGNGVVDGGFVMMNLYFKEITPRLHCFQGSGAVGKRPGIGNNLYPFKTFIPSGIQDFEEIIPQGWFTPPEFHAVERIFVGYLDFYVGQGQLTGPTFVLTVHAVIVARRTKEDLFVLNHEQDNPST